MTEIPNTPELSSKSSVCPTCGRIYDIARRCADCGAAFSISTHQQRFFESRKLELPKRCDCCRAVRRDAKRNPGTVTGPEMEVGRGYTRR